MEEKKQGIHLEAAKARQLIRSFENSRISERQSNHESIATAKPIERERQRDRGIEHERARVSENSKSPKTPRSFLLSFLFLGQFPNGKTGRRRVRNPKDKGFIFSPHTSYGDGDVIDPHGPVITRRRGHRTVRDWSLLLMLVTDVSASVMTG